MLKYTSTVYPFNVNKNKLCREANDFSLRHRGRGVNLWRQSQGHDKLSSRLKPWPQGLHLCHSVLHHAMHSCSQHWKQQNDGWSGQLSTYSFRNSVSIFKILFLTNEESVVMGSPSLVVSVILVGKFGVLNQCQNNLLEQSLCQLAALLEASRLSAVRYWSLGFGMQVVLFLNKDTTDDGSVPLLHCWKWQDASTTIYCK